MQFLGYICLGLAVLIGLMSIGRFEGFLACFGMIVMGILLLGVDEVRNRLARIEKHLGIDDEKKEDSNKAIDGIAE